MRNQDINSTFSSIRQLPLELSFDHIEQFVMQQPAPSANAGSRFRHWLNYKNILLVAFCLTAINSFFLMTHREKQPLSVTPVYITPLQTVPSVKQDVLQQPAPAATKGKFFHPVVKKPDAPKKAIMFADVRMESALLPHPKKNTSPSQTEDDKIETTPNALSLGDEKSDDPVRMRTITSGFCTFEKDEVWIKSFMKELEADHLIDDAAGLRFTMTIDSFIVNGNAQNPLLVNRYNQIYQSVTGQQLKHTSKISLSVGGSSCTLAKSIDLQ